MRYVRSPIHNSQKEQSMQRISVLNGLRGLAIIGVIFHHSFFSYIRYGLSDSAPLSPFLIIESSGWLGVNLFFFLSGFVLYLPYAAGSRSFVGWESIRKFYIHRAKRLLPLYYATTLILLIFFTGYQLNEWQFYQNFLDHLFVTFVFKKESFLPASNWVLWSLGVEIWFSILFPFLVYAIHKIGWRKTLIIVLFISLAVRLEGRWYLPVIGDRHAVLNFISDSVLGRLDEFMLGMLGAYLYVGRKLVLMPVAQLFIGVGLVSAAMLLWALWYRGNYPYSIAGLFNIPLDIGFLLIVNALLIGCSPISRLISLWPLQMSGLMCYSLYLWHGVIVSKYQPSAYSIPTYLAFLALTYCLSWLTYRYIEFGAHQDWRNLLPSRNRNVTETNVVDAPKTTL